MVMEYGFDPAMEAMYAAARELCATNDAVIGHFFVYPLRVAAEKAGVPMATLNVVHNCLPSAYMRPPGLPDFGKWFYPLGWALVRKMINRIFLPRVNALRSREGLPPDRDVMAQTWASERLNLIAVSPRICVAPKDWDKRHQVCGFLNPPLDNRMEELPAGLDNFLSAGEPPIYITFGSMMPNSLEYIRETADHMDSGDQAGWLPCHHPVAGGRPFHLRHRLAGFQGEALALCERLSPVCRNRPPRWRRNDSGKPPGGTAFHRGGAHGGSVLLGGRVETTGRRRQDFDPKGPLGGQVGQRNQKGARRLRHG